MKPALLDSDILAEVLARNNVWAAARADVYLRQFGNFRISALTLFEIKTGLAFRRKPKIGAALMEIARSLVILPVGEDEAELAGVIQGLLSRQGPPSGNVDPIIAATAITHGLTLATGSATHYQRLIDLGFPLEIEDWREPIRG
jgi:predicted nucleic acid-binding protein